MIPRLLALAILLAPFKLAPARADDPPSCTARTAEPAAIAQIRGEAPAWKGRCVSVTGLSDGFHLYADVESYYRAARAGIDPADPNARGQVGLNNRRLIRRLRRDRFSEITAIGRVQDCDEMRAIANASLGADEIGWVSGYCHTAVGPVIWLTGLRRVRPVVPLRHVGEEARAQYGDLLFAPATWPHRAYVVSRAEAFLRALKSGDRGAFAELHGGSLNPRGSEAAARLAVDPSSPFADIARGSGSPQTAILLARDDLERERQQNQVSATICYCRSGDCTGRWPIASSDADNRPERPYVCTVLMPYGLRGRDEQIFVTEQEPFGLAEPPQTAFRRQSESSRR